MIWDGKVSFSNGGKPEPCPEFGACSSDSTCCAPLCAMSPPVLCTLRACSEYEQEQERDQQREDAERFGHREAEDEVGELALGGRRIAQRGGEVMAEDRAHADAGAAHTDAGDAGTNHLCGCGVHEEAPVAVRESGFN